MREGTGKVFEMGVVPRRVWEAQTLGMAPSQSSVLRRQGLQVLQERSRQKAQRLPWQKLWNVWKKVRAHQLRRVNGEVRSFGSLAFAIAFSGMDVFWVEGEKFSVDNTRSLRQVWAGPCWEGLWPLMRDVVEMRTTASRWNVLRNEEALRSFTVWTTHQWLQIQWATCLRSL